MYTLSTLETLVYFLKVNSILDKCHLLDESLWGCYITFWRVLTSQSQKCPFVKTWSPSFLSWVTGVWGAHCSSSLWEWPQDGSVSEHSSSWKLDVRGVWLKGSMADGLADLRVWSLPKRLGTCIGKKTIWVVVFIASAWSSTGVYSGNLWNSVKYPVSPKAVIFL